MSKIEWTDVTWNPTTGCDKVSQGCKNCYAEIMHRRLMHIAPHKYTKDFLGNVEFHYGELNKPKEWRKPKKVFVNSMSDLFHKDVSFQDIKEVMMVMRYDAPQHTYQVVTKRPENYLAFIKWWNENFIIPYIPPPNMWLGVSCEDQQTADRRIPLLLQIPAAVRFLSCEPLLGPIQLDRLRVMDNPILQNCLDKIHWVIAGGESGNNARPMHPDWVRSLRDQCNAADVPFFFKQWGAYLPFEESTIEEYSKQGWLYCSAGTDDYEGTGRMIMLDNIFYAKVGKSNSGNFLDGVQHLNFPKQ